MMNKILVLGGTGFVGRSVCERLAARSASGSIVVPTRRLIHGSRLRALPTIELTELNVHDDGQLARALVGVDAVVNLIAILHGSQADFQHVHVELPRRLAAAWCMSARSAWGRTRRRTTCACLLYTSDAADE